MTTDNKNEHNSLTGKLLMAMPGIGDPRFDKAVIYICAHDQNGAMGLVINNTLEGMTLDILLKQFDIQLEDEADIPVLEGGPVETARGFILHSPDFNLDDTVKVDERLSVTGTIDALRAVAKGDGPQKMLFILGYAGWGAGQLDQEIQQNAWLTADADCDLIFLTSPEEKWEAAVSMLGIDPAMLSHEAGRA
ncbi:MAG: YqgE/AlgH family protein [Rhodospirillales bacterium]|nr:YqgE/AlgH family protein [Rhodospirillales bacterium]